MQWSERIRNIKEWKKEKKSKDIVKHEKLRIATEKHNQVRPGCPNWMYWRKTEKNQLETRNQSHQINHRKPTHFQFELLRQSSTTLLHCFCLFLFDYGKLVVIWFHLKQKMKKIEPCANDKKEKKNMVPDINRKVDLTRTALVV